MRKRHKVVMPLVVVSRRSWFTASERSLPRRRSRRGPWCTVGEWRSGYTLIISQEADGRQSGLLKKGLALWSRATGATALAAQPHSD